MAVGEEHDMGRSSGGADLETFVATLLSEFDRLMARVQVATERSLILQQQSRVALNVEITEASQLLGHRPHTARQFYIVRDRTAFCFLWCTA